MSLWRSEKIRVILHPSQVVLLRLGHGRSLPILDKRIVSCASRKPDVPPWHNSLNALMSALPDFYSGKSEVTVVLSNHFVRYVLINHMDQVSSVEEEQALLQHHFARIYGDAVSKWNLTISHAQHRNSPRVACAIDQELIAALRKLIKPTKHVLHSIQPYLMNAFNQYRQCLSPTAWLVLVEDGVFCLARLEEGSWQTIKCIRIGNDWQNELAMQLEREELLLLAKTIDSEKSRTPVFVFSPEYPEPIDVAEQLSTEKTSGENTIHILDPSQWPKPTESEEQIHAMALIG